MLNKLYHIRIFCFFLLCSLQIQAQEITSILGFAPQYIGHKVEIYGIEDYLSLKEHLLAQTTVKEDSTFKLSFFNNQTKQIIIRSNNNKAMMYIQPGSNYHIYLPHKNKYDEYRPLGNDVELAFADLEETDINFKILSFDKWSATFLGEYFYRKNLTGLEFVQQLDSFKLNLEQSYKSDTSFFFRTYVRFTLASLDNIQYKGDRNRFEKYDFYLKQYPLAYENPVYMEYLNQFFTNIDDHLPMETGNRMYLGVLKSSPSLIINALRDEPSLSSLRIREYVMIKALGEHYFKGDYPKTNILTILDSLSIKCIYPEHQIIAANLKLKLTAIQTGTLAPDFQLSVSADSIRTKRDFLKKHLYIQFLDLDIQESKREVELLIPLYKKYKDFITILTIYKEPENPSPQQLEQIQKIPWEKYAVNSDAEILKAYAIKSFPAYVLLDHYGYVVAAPALRPSPNGQYETIDKSFFYIKKMIEEERKNGH